MVLADPKPKELVFCIGGATDQGLKVMVNIARRARLTRVSILCF